jgi:3-oxoacyl-[acyl-carrier-protein] synthase II
MQPHDVVITGVGAVSPHGIGADALWRGLLAGRSAAGTITAFDPAGFGVRFACEVREDVDALLPRRLVRQTDRFARLALLAAEEALAQAGLLAPAVRDVPPPLHRPLVGVDPDRVGAVVASGVGGIGEVLEQHRRLLEHGPDRVRPYLSVAMGLNMAGGQIALRHGLRGPVSAVASACASGADAIGHALDALAAGRADVILAGGAEAAITPLTIAGFDAAGAMSRRNDDPAAASRPFDVDRDGFVAGEGAGLLVLERAAHAAARGAAPLARLAGYGASDDAHDPTQPSPGGEGAVRALRAALADADLSPDDVDHVNAHGTATPLGDAAESAALRTTFGDRGLPVTATKSSIGHLLGAAGAVEAVTVVRTLQDQRIHPTRNLDRQDPGCPVDVVVEATDARLEAAVSASFGFGGHNAVLVLTRT